MVCTSNTPKELNLPQNANCETKNFVYDEQRNELN